MEAKTNNDAIKAALKLDTASYELLYLDVSTRMADQDILGRQLRSIASKAETRSIGRAIREEHREMFNDIADHTFESCIFRIAQRVNSNHRRRRIRSTQETCIGYAKRAANRSDAARADTSTAGDDKTAARGRRVKKDKRHSTQRGDKQKRDRKEDMGCREMEVPHRR